MRRRRKKIKIPGVVFVVAAILLGVLTGSIIGRALSSSGRQKPAILDGASSVPPVSEPESTPPEDNPAAGITARDYAAIPLPEEYRAMWVSFLDLQKVDWTDAGTARADFATMFDNCKTLGMNTVVVQVRPFGDALYESTLFPWTHIINDSQGYWPGFDPLAVMVEEAHSRGLRLEAWINPYRVRSEKHGPSIFNPENPAAINPDWVIETSTMTIYNPAIPEVQQLVVDGVVEILQNYDVDGVHFDDYFYPELTAEDNELGLNDSMDAEQFEAYEGELSRADWRRENVNSLVSQVYTAVKAANPTASFGISPQGNNENNYNTQYSDVKKWMAEAGYVDYVMPQLYWGFGHVDAAGKDTAAFNKKTDEWAFFPRAEGVRLYAGLGAYRIGGNDGNGAGDPEEWHSGQALADQVAHLRTVNGFTGFGLFRYGNLYLGESDETLAAEETAALGELLK